ncbi:hypothetical protein SLEP1_g29693 [Rubroshorea leprosula]|uniref:Integrase catalytic domain-containing protein n=1 Tax=Rubroshorea leprosula TaxID=152421 RepID=A0AAV5K6N7_9ROSI|nr:hypothetical protein SLEP1_g29693 [Rubroshorea leprosula]
MPPKRNVGKAAQTLQIGLGNGSPTHSEGENEPVIPPPLSPILGEHSFFNPTFNKDSEFGDDVAQSGDSLVKANLAHNLAQSVAQNVADMRRSNEESNRIWRKQNAKNWRAFQAEMERMQEAFRCAGIEPQPQVANLQRIQFILGGRWKIFFTSSSTAVSQKCPWQIYLVWCSDLEKHLRPFLLDFGRADLSAELPCHNKNFSSWHKMDKIDKGILHFLDKAKETMGVDADPFPTMSVEVNAADLKSIVRDRTQTYYRRRLVADDLRWVIEEARARKNQVRSGSYRRRQPGGHNPTQQKNNASQGTAIYGRAEKPKMVKPRPRTPTKRWERVVHPKFPKGQNPRTLRRRLQRKRAAERHRQQIADSGGMADQAQPLPIRRKLVWVRKEKGSTFGQNSPEKEEPPKIPTSPQVLAVESNEEIGLKAKFDVSDKAKNSSDVICFGEFSVNLSCLVITLPLVFQAREQPEYAVCHQTDLTEEEEVIKIPAKEDGGMDSADKIIFEKPEERMAKHIRPLYIHAHLDGMPINQVPVDNGAAVNVFPTCILQKIGKSLGDLMETEVTISDFTGGVNCSRGILPVELTVGNRTLMCAFFVVDTIATYNALLRRDWIHSSWYVPSTLHQKLIFWNAGRTEVMTTDDKPFVANTNVVEARYYDEDIGTIRFFGMDRYGRPSGITACTRSAMDRQTVKEEDFKDQITLEELDLAPAKLDDLKAEVQDGEGLDRNLVQYRLPIREDLKPFKQPPKRMSPEVTLKVKKEIERLLKNGKLRICVDFRNLNLATPKDEYPMPIADLLVDGAARHRILSFMDGHSGYNQIFIAEEDIPKTAFRCLGAIVQLLKEFDDVILRHVTRDLNTEANEMAQIASDLKIPEGVMSRIVVVEKRILPSIHMRGMAISACSIDVTQTDWRYPIMEYLKNPNFKASRRTKMQALNYVLLEDVLYRRGHDELLLRYLGPDEYCQIMSDVHNGICGAHQAGIKMRWLIRRHGFFCPSILKDCISYAKGCKACQIHGPLQRVPTSELHPIVKPWPFRGFGLAETVTSDQGTVFVGAQVEAFAKEMGFRLLTSTPHYAQANGEAEASNRIVINLSCPTGEMRTFPTTLSFLTVDLFADGGKNIGLKSKMRLQTICKREGYLPADCKENQSMKICSCLSKAGRRSPFQNFLFVLLVPAATSTSTVTQS